MRGAESSVLCEWRWGVQLRSVAVCNCVVLNAQLHDAACSPVGRCMKDTTPTAAGHAGVRGG